MLLVLAGAGMASGTMWLYTDPTFFTTGYQPSSAGSSVEYQFSAEGSFKPMGLSPFEIINAPFFPLIGQAFSATASAAQTQAQNSTQTVMLGSTGKLDNAPQPLTFSGGNENNLKYAESKSSIKVGQSGSWTSLSNPWLV